LSDEALEREAGEDSKVDFDLTKFAVKVESEVGGLRSK
jgi:hypothetical protein